MADYIDPYQYASLIGGVINPNGPEEDQEPPDPVLKQRPVATTPVVSRPAPQQASTPSPSPSAAPDPAQLAQPTGQTQPASPATVSASGNASPSVTKPNYDWPGYMKRSLDSAQSAQAKSQAAIDALQSMPTEDQTIAPLEAKRVQAATPIDRTQPQYKPGIGSRIVRGIDAIRRGGILGAADPADVGGKAYGAPNRQYDIDTANQQSLVGNLDQQINAARTNYKDASARLVDNAKLQHEIATGALDAGKVTSGMINAGTKQNAVLENATKNGQKPVMDDQNNITGFVDDPESAAYKARQSLSQYREAMQGVAQMKADIEKQKVTPGTPAWNQAQQKINETSLKAQAYWGNYLMHSKNVDAGGNVLPGAPQISDDSGNQTVVGTANAATAIKNNANASQFNDVNGSLDGLEKSARALVASGEKPNSALIASALAQPKGTAGKWLQGQLAKANLTSAQRDYVTNLVASHENIQALRKSAGGGGTDSQVDRLLSMLPDASTPDLDYFLRQTGQIRQTASRIGKGAAQATGGLHVRGQGAASNPDASDMPPQSVVDGMKENQYVHSQDGTHSYQKKGGKLVPVGNR